MTAGAADPPLPFNLQAALLIEKLESEAASGEREPALDAELDALRARWQGLTGPEQEHAAASASALAGLTGQRPAAAEPVPPPMPVTDEQAEAAAALQGLTRVRQATVSPARRYEGPRDADRLLTHMGYDRFRPGQREAVDAALAGRDSLVVMPTGGGKSLCYQLPALADDRLTVVVSPLIALMADQVSRLASEGHPAVMFASGLSAEEFEASRDAVASGHARIAYCSPERFGSSSFMDLITNREIDLLAIDEAHCISEWGHDFRPDYLRLPAVAERLGRPPVMACTATATPEVAAEIASRMDLADPARIYSGFDRPNLSFDVVTFEGKGSKARKAALLEYGLKQPDSLPAIVYCGTRRDTDEVAESLAAIGLGAVAYHAGLAPDERASAQHQFMAGDADVVVATNAFGMGVDKADVRSVWHWAVPSSVEAYYQEAGRAGRDGKPARAVLLAGRADLSRLVHFNQQRRVEPSTVEDYVAELRHQSGPDGSATVEAPRSDRDRVRLAIAERAGLLTVEPAASGRLLVRPGEQVDPGAVAAACRVAEDRGWRAYRAVEEFSFTDGCRRRRLLDHFGDDSPTRPEGRCCDFCDPDNGLPDPASLVTRRPAQRQRKSDPPPELAAPDAALFEALRAWRLEAADGQPAFMVASNRTLTAIATARPADEDQLAEIKGVGPAFLEKYGAAVLRLVADQG